MQARELLGLETLEISLARIDPHGEGGRAGARAAGLHLDPVEPRPLGVFPGDHRQSPAAVRELLGHAVERHARSVRPREREIAREARDLGDERLAGSEVARGRAGPRGVPEQLVRERNQRAR